MDAEVERSARYQALPDPTLDRGESTFATAVAKACAAAAGQLGIGTICVYTRTGETARQVAEYRPQARIIAFTPSLEPNLYCDWMVICSPRAIFDARPHPKPPP